MIESAFELLEVRKAALTRRLWWECGLLLVLVALLMLMVHRGIGGLFSVGTALLFLAILSTNTAHRAEVAVIETLLELRAKELAGKGAGA